MLSNKSRSLKTRSDAPHNTVIGDVDGVFAINRKLTLVPRPDMGDREIHCIGPESTNAANVSPLPFWSVAFANLMEGFVLYGAAVHPNAFPVELFRTGHDVSQPDEIFQPRRLRAVVASPTEHPEQPPGETAVAGFVESDGVTPAGAVRRSVRRLWNSIAAFWADWRREREMKKAVYALAEFDDRILRDMGICHRSEIERAVRQGRYF